MKKLNIQLLAVLFTALILGFTSCDKNDDDNTPTTEQPKSQNTKYEVSTEDASVSQTNAAITDVQSYSVIAVNGNTFDVDPGIAYANATTEGSLNLFPVSGGPAFQNLTANPDSWFTNVNYKGAFGTTNWADGWTLSSKYMSNGTYTMPTVPSATEVITDDGSGTGTTTWTSDKVYILDGLVFVNDGQTLTIEAGTIIKGKPGQGENASALIVARGGKIMAEGNANAPIIFTSEADDLQGGVSDFSRGDWGGVILLGKAGLNSSPGESAIEGIPTSEPRGIYGGSDDNDNSGVLKYVSIRHGGTDIGEGNEINGLTLGGIGSATTIEFVEIIANKDDGVEFFGGMPRLKNIIVSFVGDDCFDYDEGFRGYGQFWAAIQDPAEGDRLGEHDGGTDPEDGTPYATPYIYNATYIGRGANAGKRTITMRDNAGGHYANSIFLNQAKGVDIELLADGQCSYNRFKDGDLIFMNNIFFNVGE